MNNYSLIHELFIKPIEEGHINRIVLIDGDKSYTYGQIFTRIENAAGDKSFQKYAVGDLVACHLQNPIETVIVFFALIYRGLVPCILNPNTPHSAYSNGLEKANCKAVIETEIQSERTQSDLIVHDIAFALFTSGTAGNPSLVFHRHADPILMNEYYGKQILGLTENDLIFTSSRFYFAYGLNALFFALINKARLIIPAIEFSPESLVNQLIEQKPTIFFSVPTLYKRLLEAMPERLALNSLRLCISAGENLPLAIFERWKAVTGNPILDGIGTTEILSTFISNRPDDIKPGSTGIPVPGFIAEIRDLETGQTVKKGQIGVLWVKGETYLPYYPNNPAETSQRFIDGWFMTNDLFSEDQNGFYFNHGRANELIKVSGIWIYPYKIEASLLAHPAVNEAIVTGFKDSDGLMRLQAHIVMNETFCSDENLSKELRDWVKQRLSRHEYPHFIHYVDAIPKTPSGKSKRFLLAQQTQKELVNA